MSGPSYADSRRGLESEETSCVALVSSFLERIREFNPDLNAFIEVDERGSMERARVLDLERETGVYRPLTGMVVGVKDLICTKGLPTTCGSDVLRGFRSVYSATVVKRLLDAGAIIIGKTNCDEFAMGSSNESSCFGPVHHPLDLERVPGGSSGGSAAAVRAGLCHVALGTDTGGSIRQPAAFCGVVGLKPTYGLVSRYGLVAYASSFDCIGPLATTVQDSRDVLRIISGPDPNDATSLQTRSPDMSAPDASAADGSIATELSENPPAIRSVKGLRVGLPEEYFSEGLADGVRERVQDAAHALERAGAVLVDVSLPHTRYGIAAYYVLTTAEASSNLSRYDGIRYGNRVEATEPDATALQAL